jgi:hypothetical protein
MQLRGPATPLLTSHAHTRGLQLLHPRTRAGRTDEEVTPVASYLIDQATTAVVAVARPLRGTDAVRATAVSRTVMAPFFVTDEGTALFVGSGALAPSSYDRKAVTAQNTKDTQDPHLVSVQQLRSGPPV